MSSADVKAESRRAALKEAVAWMKTAGVDTPVLDARLIVQHALGVDWQALFLGPDLPLDSAERARLAQALARRAAGEPVSRIVGHRHFWTLDLTVTPDTLDPRADTEAVIEAVLAARPDRGRVRTILDLGVGAGALLLAFLAEYPEAYGVGLDRSPAALAVAGENAARHGLAGRAAFVAGDWCAPLAGSSDLPRPLDLPGPFDLIVSNPPYIRHDALAGLPREVREHDPPLALDGGADGLDAYRAILSTAPALLAKAGLLALELGEGQAEPVARMASQRGLETVALRRDLGGVARALVLAPAGEG